MLTALLELLGLICLVVAATLVAIPLGFLVGGLALIYCAYALDGFALFRSGGTKT